MQHIAAQIAAVRAELETRPEGLVRHVQRVLVEALDLAARWDLDPARVELATWGHDLFRSFPPAEQLRLAVEAGLPIVEADRADRLTGGILLDLALLKQALRAVVEPLDHEHLNDVLSDAFQPPTAEHIGLYIAGEMVRRLG